MKLGFFTITKELAKQQNALIHNFTIKEYSSCLIKATFYKFRDLAENEKIPYYRVIFENKNFEVTEIIRK